MKYYAIKMAENQYDVIEIDGSESMRIYQVGEEIVKDMYSLAEQEKLNLVIQDPTGFITYVKMKPSYKAECDKSSWSMPLHYVEFVSYFLVVLLGGEYPIWVKILIALALGGGIVTVNLLLAKIERHFSQKHASYKYMFQVPATILPTIAKPNWEDGIKKVVTVKITIGITTILIGLILNLCSLKSANIWFLFIEILIGILISVFYGSFKDKENERYYRGRIPIITPQNQIIWERSKMVRKQEIQPQTGK